MNVIRWVSPELKDLYVTLEEDFQPLQLWNKVSGWQLTVVCP